MSALPPKADMCSALGDVHFVPKKGTFAGTHHVGFVSATDSNTADAVWLCAQRSRAISRALICS